MLASKFSRKFFAIFLLLVGAILGAFYFTSTHLALSFDYQKEGVSPAEEWRISFGQDVVGVSAGIFPEIKGEWRAYNGFFGTSGIGFIPEKGFEKGVKYTAVIELSRTYEKSKIIRFDDITFLVSPAPGVISLVIDGGRKSASPSPDIELITTKDLAGKVLTLSILGEDSTFEQVSQEGTRTVWHATKDFSQGKRFSLQIHDENKNLIIQKDFETVIEPVISNFFVREPVFPGDTMTIVFNTAMRATSSPVITDIPGSGAWFNSKTYVHTIESVSPNKTYVAKLPVGALSEDGGKVTTELEYHIKSPGYLTPVFSGISRTQNIDESIEVSFDQPVDKESAERAFRISPIAKGKLSWQKEKLVFTPAKLSNQQKYTVSMSAGVKAKFGLPSKSKVSASFSTAPEVYKLDVPYFAQEYSRSCEAASLRMALAYHGVYVNDMDILEKVGYDPKPKDVKNNTWDDPRVMFVGYASSADGDGYGVYGEPIARAAENFGRTANYTRSITPQSLAKNIKNGDPVVLWGYTSLSMPKSKWSVPGGDEVTILPGEHARVVVGIYGSVSNPIGFYLHDPLNGKRYEYWSADDLIQNFTKVPGVTDQAVVVG